MRLSNARVWLKSGKVASTLALCVLRAGCADERSQWVPPDRECPGALKPVWIADSSLTICVVTSFRTHDLRTWTRTVENTMSDVFEVRTDMSTTEAALTGGWPPTLRAVSGNRVLPESMTLRTDTIAGTPAHTEIGLLANTIEGQRISAFVSGWITNDAHRVVVHGQSASRATLDTMLLMLRSAESWQSQSNSMVKKSR